MRAPPLKSPLCCRHDSVQLSCLDTDSVMSWLLDREQGKVTWTEKLTTHSEGENCKTSKSVLEFWSNVSQRTTAARTHRQGAKLIPDATRWLWIIDQMHLHNMRPSADVEQLHTGERFCQCAVFSKETFARHFLFQNKSIQRLTTVTVKKKTVGSNFNADPITWDCESWAVYSLYFYTLCGISAFFFFF